MVTKKPQSKRFTTRHRAKVDKKLREHRRKVNKDAKVKGPSKGRKDPGIPTNFPGRTEFVQQMQAEREKEKMQRQMAIARNDIQSLAQQATSKAVKPEEEEGESAAEGKGKFFDTSKRAFYREFRQVVEKADVILTVLDARDPMGCRVREVEEMVNELGGRKRIVLVLNKIDLVPREVVKNWLTVLRKELPTVAFKASTQSQRSNIGSIKMDIDNSDSDKALSSSECLGADTLIQLLKNYCRSLNIKTSISVGVVGYPNVGKSSLINSLKRSKVCRVGSTPGVTTASQEIHLDKNIKLIDCPGIVFASPSAAAGNNTEMAHLFLRNCLKVEQLEDPVSPVELILQKSTPEQLMILYSLPRFTDTNEFLCHIAKRQGKLKKGGIPNIEAAAKAVLNDWNQGKIPFYMLPPVQPVTTSSVEQAVVVSSWAPEFDLESLCKMEVDTVLSAVPETLPTIQPIVMETEPRLVIDASLVKGKKGANQKDDYTISLSAVEMENNPQLNRLRAKTQKQSKKAAVKKALASTIEMVGNDDGMEVDEAYDFATDFKQ